MSRFQDTAHNCVLTFHAMKSAQFKLTVSAGASGVSLWKLYSTAERENNPVSRCLHVKYCYEALCAPAARVEKTLTAIRSATGPPV